MEKIKGVLVSNGEAKEYELEYNNYKDFYPLLNCDTFDVQSRKFNGEWLDIYCDDEGLFKANNKPSILTFSNGELVEQIVGNAFIVAHNDEGDTISLTDEQVQKVMATITTVIYKFKKLRVLQATI
jgi:hypothetical protein